MRNSRTLFRQKIWKYILLFVLLPDVCLQYVQIECEALKNPPSDGRNTFHLSRATFGNRLLPLVLGGVNLVNVWDSTSALPPTQTPPTNSINEIRLPLRFLPKSGCWALRTTLTNWKIGGEVQDDDDDQEESFVFGAIVDTGSPFLTAPMAAESITRPVIDKSKNWTFTNEQYGVSLGDIQWRQVDLGTWIGVNGELLEAMDLTVGLASPKLIEETGGIFAGLILKDDNHPTFMQQIGRFQSFQIIFLPDPHPSMLLSTSSLLPETIENTLVLFDLSPFGPDLYHYAVLGHDLKLFWSNGTATQPTLSRPLVIVLDTGLTGCILHDSIAEDLGVPSSFLNTETLAGLTVKLKTEDNHNLELRSDDKYWQMTCFELPWFCETTKTKRRTAGHPPHILAVGATVWSQMQSLTVDSITKRALVVAQSGHPL